MLDKSAAVLLLPFLFGFTAVPPETLTTVGVSNRDVNRVVCPVRVSDVVYSKEKPVEFTVKDRNIFIKFLIRKDGGKDILYGGDLDTYIICGDAVYHVLFQAKNTQPATIMLQNDMEKVRKGIDVFKGETHETKLLKFLSAAYTEEYPDGIAVKDLMEAPSVDYPGAQLLVRRKATAAGSGLMLTEYLLTPESAVEIRETDFLKLAKYPLLVSVGKTNIQAGETVRIFLIESTLGFDKSGGGR